MLNLGKVNASSTIRIPLSSNLSNGERADYNNDLEVGDFFLYKNGSLIERTSTAGWDIINIFDGATGLQELEIDLSDDTDAGFYSEYADYKLRQYPDETIDGQLISAWAATFRIQTDLSGYKDGRVYINSGAGNTNTQPGVDGTINNPVSTLAAGKTLADPRGKKLDLDGLFSNQAIDLTAYNLRSTNGMAFIDGDAITGITIVDGIATNIGLEGDMILNQSFRAFNCRIKNIDNVVALAGLQGHFYNCRFEETNEMSTSSGQVHIYDGAGSSDFAPFVSAKIAPNVNSTLMIQGWSGLLDIINQTDAGATSEIYADEDARIEFPASNTAGSISWKGFQPTVFLATSTLINLNTSDFNSRGYKDGLVYIDEANGFAGSIPGLNGTFDRPSNNEADVKILGDLFGKKLGVFGTAQLDSPFDNYFIKGIDGSARIDAPSPNGGNPSFDGTFFEDIDLAGSILVDAETKYLRCLFDSIDGAESGLLMGTARDCLIKGINKLKGDFILNNCSSFDNTAELQYGSNNTVVTLNNYQGPLKITEMDISEGHFLDVYSDGDSDITLDATCTDGDSLFVGIGNKTDNSGAGHNVTDADWSELPIASAGDVTLAVNAQNHIVIATGVDLALDAANTALAAIPNSETGSIREWIQLSISLLKLRKKEVAATQTIFKENDSSVFATRAITVTPTDVIVGRVI